jgi:hypothetical protein
MNRILDSSMVLFYLLAGGAGLIAGLIAGGVRRDGAGGIIGRAVEGAILAPLGGFLARAFISTLLAAGHDSPETALAVGWGFFLWPGAIDTFLALLHNKPIFTAEVLLWTAAAVGSFVGLMDGVWRIHPWIGLGVFTFLADVTWGLAGSTNGGLVHLINFAWADHKDDPRSAAHRYYDGFCVKAGFAFTQGAVMSNLRAGAGDLVDHEFLHVIQNRFFGPLFTLTYVGWMAVMLLPALVVGLFKGSPGQTVEGWCYANNPWEAWAYAVGGGRDPKQVWGAAVMAVVTVIFFLGAVAAAVWVVKQVWLH